MNILLLNNDCRMYYANAQTIDEKRITTIIPNLNDYYENKYDKKCKHELLPELTNIFILNGFHNDEPANSICGDISKLEAERYHANVLLFWGLKHNNFSCIQEIKKHYDGYSGLLLNEKHIISYINNCTFTMVHHPSFDKMVKNYDEEIKNQIYYIMDNYFNFTSTTNFTDLLVYLYKNDNVDLFDLLLPFLNIKDIKLYTYNGKFVINDNENVPMFIHIYNKIINSINDSELIISVMNNNIKSHIKKTIKKDNKSLENVYNMYNKNPYIMEVIYNIIINIINNTHYSSIEIEYILESTKIIFKHEHIDKSRTLTNKLADALAYSKNNNLLDLIIKYNFVCIKHKWYEILLKSIAHKNYRTTKFLLSYANTEIQKSKKNYMVSEDCAKNRNIVVLQYVVFRFKFNIYLNTYEYINNMCFAYYALNNTFIRNRRIFIMNELDRSLKINILHIVYLNEVNCKYNAQLYLPREILFVLIDQMIYLNFKLSDEYINFIKISIPTI